jgi:hypothetical protein
MHQSASKLATSGQYFTINSHLALQCSIMSQGLMHTCMGLVISKILASEFD